MIEINIDKVPRWIFDLEPDDLAFVKNFILHSGLAVDSKLDLETAKGIIEKYNSEKRDAAT